ncbi:ATP-binding response regulator [Vibrio sonorensis]|uniref:ATP-binding response regulator n=1 Tax=Vibrio sonorensis TaxID=1004316 RepID=UPI0008D8DB39|nr:hybrid sensor histidine kinase/response regulator [Vibrio sonorensis]
MVKEAVRKIYEYAEPNLTLVGWMGFIGFPVYYYTWVYLFPQPYESLTLRILGSIMFGVIAFRKQLPNHIQKHFAYYYLVTIGACLPFFFSFMMFKNGWNTVWAMSFMASIFLHILLVHTSSIMLSQAAICIALAYFSVYGLDSQQASQEVVWPYIPIFIFTYVFGNLFFFRNQVEHETKVSIAKYFGAGIAHEMRNPLGALKASLEVLNSVLPNPKLEKSQSYRITADEVALAREVLTDAQEVIRTGNETIDLLLTSIDQNRVSTSTFVKHSVAEVTQQAIDSFSYKKASDRRVVKVDLEQDFQFLGSDTLLKYALYNLLKNAFYYQNNDRFEIEIKLRKGDTYNELTFIDNGVGIDPDTMENIFKDFYTSGKTNSYGLGLPFCKKVMKAVRGDITCRSIVGEWTLFTLTFPSYESKDVDQLKLQLIKDKSILYIGEEGQLSKMLSESAFYQGFSLTFASVDSACCRQEYEFEYNVILIDLDVFNEKPNQRSQLENLLHFTEAKIVYLYNRSHRYHNNYDRHLSFEALEKHSLLLDSKKVVNELFFNADTSNRNVIPTIEKVTGKTILIADDNHSLRNYTSILLEQQGFEVIQVQDGEEALEKIAGENIDLILMDIEMPKIDGLQATNEIRTSNQVYANIPILGHTGDSTPPAIEKIQQAGMNDYIIKPAPTDHLLDKISNWI